MKTVFITGGSRGIGKAMVELFSEKGYVVGFTYKNSRESALLLSEATGAYPYRADCESDADIEAAVRSFTEEHGGIDVLINNVGMSAFSLFTDISLDDWNKMLRVNLTSAFLFTKAALPNMISKKWGRIINVSSMWGVSGASCEVHYSVITTSTKPSPSLEARNPFSSVSSIWNILTLLIKKGSLGSNS